MRTEYGFSSLSLEELGLGDGKERVQSMGFHTCLLLLVGRREKSIVLVLGNLRKRPSDFL
jgi:hypothetical protein